MFATLVTGYGVIDEYVGPFLTETREFSLGTIGVDLRIAVCDAYDRHGSRASTAGAFVARHRGVVCARHARSCRTARV